MKSYDERKQRGRYKVEDNVLKVRKVENGYVVNTATGMHVATSLDEVIQMLKDKYKEG